MKSKYDMSTAASKRVAIKAIDILADSGGLKSPVPVITELLEAEGFKVSSIGNFLREVADWAPESAAYWGAHFAEAWAAERAERASDRRAIDRLIYPVVQQILEENKEEA